MPINARPEYFKAEEKYHKASTPEEKIRALEEMLRVAPSHKGAENLRAGLKQKLSKLRVSLEKNRQQSKGKGNQPTIKREGAAQVALISITNAGKSALLQGVTNAKPEVADYAYTTTKPEVGIMNVGGANIQLIEIPSFFEDFAYKGDGPTYFSIIRNVDLVVFVIDTTQDEIGQLNLLFAEFEKAQVKLNAKKPKISIKKQGVGGIEWLGKRHCKFAIREGTKMLTSTGFHNATVTIHQSVTLEDLADVLNESLVYLPLLTIYTKSDITNKGVSAKTGKGLDKLKEKIFDALRLIRIYTKSPGKKKDFPPVSLHKGESIRDLAAIIHKDFYKKFRYARIWGKSAKHDGQTVGLEHKLKDQDIVEFHLK